jgi:hypothetical protein
VYLAIARRLVIVTQKKPGGKLLPPGAANGNDKPYFGRAAASAAIARTAQKLASINEAHG